MRALLGRLERAQRVGDPCRRRQVPGGPDHPRPDRPHEGVHRRTRTSPTSACIGTPGRSRSTATSYSDLDYSTYGWVTSSTRYSRGVNLYGNIYEGYAWAGYSFTLPAATKYGTLSFKVLGKPSRGTAFRTSLSGTTLDETRTASRWVGRSYAWYFDLGGRRRAMSARGTSMRYVTALGENSRLLRRRQGPADLQVREAPLSEGSQGWLLSLCGRVPARISSVRFTAGEWRSWQRTCFGSPEGFSAVGSGPLSVRG